jgi:hypothetical protein
LRRARKLLEPDERKDLHDAAGLQSVAVGSELKEEEEHGDVKS